jgi:galactose-1-phosphate uridylyltransferase
MAKITFETSEAPARILSPLKAFAEDFHRIEVRKDPLLGHRSIYNPSLKEKVKFFFGECDQTLIEEMVAATARTCPFCPERLDASTPRYPSDFIPEGRMRLGEAVLFPNLYPLGKYHTVIRLTETHFLRLSQFSPAVLKTGFQLARHFIRHACEVDRDACYFAVNANYLFPAGATLVHPHLQMLVTPEPLTHHERLLEAGKSYFREHGTPYLLDLVSEERRINERYVASKGKWHWISAFSPLGMNEFMAIHEKDADFRNLTDADLGDLARGISKVLCLYEDLGYLSFNYSLLSAREPLFGESSRCLLRIINRQNLYHNYRNDDYFLQKILSSDFIINTPEDLSNQLKAHFQR